MEFNLVKLEFEPEQIGESAGNSGEQKEFCHVVEKRVHRETRYSERMVQLLQKFSSQFQHVYRVLQFFHLFAGLLFRSHVEVHLRL